MLEIWKQGIQIYLGRLNNDFYLWLIFICGFLNVNQ